MRTGLQLAFVALLVAGCAGPSRFKNDPRAAVVGPDYLDYIEHYPKDRDTQYYYPQLAATEANSAEAPSAGGPGSVPANIHALMTQTAKEPPPSVQKIEGKGWAELQRKGIPF
jgi:hypothetical protein